MFKGCSNLTTLDLSNFNTLNVTNMREMFYNCSSLKTIYVSNNFVTYRVTIGDSNNMFSGCSALEGGNGTKYNENHTNGYYARIDTKEYPAYFTNKTTEETSST